MPGTADFFKLFPSFRRLVELYLWYTLEEIFSVGSFGYDGEPYSDSLPALVSPQSPLNRNNVYV